MNLSALSVQDIIPSAQSNSGKSTSEAAAEKAEQEKTDFLNLLLTQLSNQNPLDPMDTDEWTAQLTRYSILEQGIETNEQLSITNGLLKTNATASTLSYIGKEVELETNIGVIQNGQAQWSYEIEGSPDDVYLTVSTKDGAKIAEVEGSISPGVNSASLDAADFGLAEGQQVYLSINATDKDGNKLNSTTTTTLTVDGSWADARQTYLTAGGASFKTSDILKIAEGSSDKVVISDPSNDGAEGSDDSSDTTDDS